MQDFEKYIQQSIEKQNRQGRAELEGYSPLEIDLMLYDFLNPKCPIQINFLKEEEYLEIPLFNQVKYLLQLIVNSGELKLTQRGNLPVKVVADLYKKGFLKDPWVEKGFAKVYNEERIPSIIISRVLLELSSLVKKRNNNLSLTAKGSKILKSNRLLFQELYQVSTLKYNWAFLDGYEDAHIGQFGFVFSLILLHKYGEIEKNVDFYARKYFQAFPMLLENSSLSHSSAYSAYSFRTFENFLKFYGLVELGQKNYLDPQMVKTTPLFHRLIKIMPPDPLFISQS